MSLEVHAWIIPVNDTWRLRTLNCNKLTFVSVWRAFGELITLEVTASAFQISQAYPDREGEVDQTISSRL